MTPKRVDHDARRALVADAVLSLVAREGVAAASYRRVAQETGFSVGSLQHYFENGEEMLDVAFARIGVRREERVKAEISALGRPPTPREVLEASLRTGLPLDEERRVECLAEAAWVIRAGAGKGTNPSHGLPLLLGLFRGLLESARAQGMLARGVDPELEAQVLWALVGVQGSRLALDGSAPPERALAVVEYHVDRLFTSPADPAAD